MDTDKKINKINLEIVNAIKKISEENGVKIGIKIGDKNLASYTLSLKVLLDGEKVQKSLEIMSSKIGFTQNIIGMEFEHGNNLYRIENIKLRNRKYPIIAVKKSNGVSYKFPPKLVKDLIGGDKIINRNANLDKLIK